MRTLELDPHALRPSVLTPPLSKSDAHRALLIADLVGAELPLKLDDPTLPRDVVTLARGLDVLRQARERESFPTIDCEDGGAPFRFLLAQAAIRPIHVSFTGTARLGARPHQPLIDALKEALPRGLQIKPGAPWPLEVTGTAQTTDPKFRISAAASSQFASSLVMAAAALALRQRMTWTVELVGPTASEGYLELTLRWLEREGFRLARSTGRIDVRGWDRPNRADRPSIPGDWSSLGYLLLVAWKSKGFVARVDERAEHPDRAMAGILKVVGLTLTPAGEGIQVNGKASGGIVASAAESPDLIPTLAALACVLPGTSQFTSVDILKEKESDRLLGVRELVRAAGGTEKLEGNALSVTPPAFPAKTLTLKSHGDHRLAMSAAVLAILIGATLTLEDPDCVDKSFPGLWGELERAGVGLRFRTV